MIADHLPVLRLLDSVCGRTLGRRFNLDSTYPETTNAAPWSQTASVEIHSECATGSNNPEHHRPRSLKIENVNARARRRVALETILSRTHSPREPLPRASPRPRPQRGYVTQPGVAATRLPWVNGRPANSNPEWVVAPPIQRTHTDDNRFLHHKPYPAPFMGLPRRATRRVQRGR